MRVRYPFALLAAGLFWPVLAIAQPLDDAALRAVTVGKTQQEYFGQVYHHETYFAPDGHAMVAFKISYFRPFMQMRWEIKDGRLCLADLDPNMPCVQMVKQPDGTLTKDYGNGHVVTVRIVEGDADRLMATKPGTRQGGNSVADLVGDHSATAILPPGNYLTAEQIKPLVSGKTLDITDRQLQSYGGKPADRFHYYAADGTYYFMSYDGNVLPFVARGTWYVDNDRLCTRDVSASPCYGIRQVKGDPLQAVYPGVENVWNIAILNGDPKQVAETVNHSYPYNQEPKPNQAVPTALLSQ